MLYHQKTLFPQSALIMATLNPIGDYLSPSQPLRQFNVAVLDGLDQIEQEQESIDTLIYNQLANRIQTIENTIEKIGTKIVKPLNRDLSRIENNLEYITSEVGSQIQRDLGIVESTPRINDLSSLLPTIPITSSESILEGSSSVLTPSPGEVSTIPTIPPLPPTPDIKIPPFLQQPFPIGDDGPIFQFPAQPPIDFQLPPDERPKHKPPKKVVIQCPPNDNPPIISQVKCGDNTTNLVVNVPIPIVQNYVTVEPAICPPQGPGIVPIPSPIPPTDLISACRDRNDFIDLLSTCGLDKSEQELKEIGIDVNSLGKFTTVQELRSVILSKWYVKI